MKFLHLIWANLKRRKLRTVLTFLSILVAFLLFGLLAAIKAAFNGGISMAGADRLVIRHRVSIIQSLPISYKERIEQVPGVVRVSHATWFGGYYQKPDNTFFAQTPMDPEAFMDVYPEYKISAEVKKAWRDTRTGVVIGPKLAQRFGWKVGDKVPIQATIWEQKDGNKTWTFDVVGIYDIGKQGTDQMGFFFRYDYFDEARSFNKGQVGWYIIKVGDPAKSVQIAKQIDDLFANSPAETKTETEMAFVQGFAKQIGDIGAIMTAILTAVFFTILLVVGNTMAQSVRERRSELGVLKALGFTNGQTLGLVLSESVIMAAAGGAAGLGVAWLFISRGDPTGGVLPDFYFPTHDLVLGVGLFVALGFITGFVPALQAMKLNVADALRRM